MLRAWHRSFHLALASAEAILTALPALSWVQSVHSFKVPYFAFKKERLVSERDGDVCGTLALIYHYIYFFEEEL